MADLPQPILLVGFSGMLARAWIRLLDSRGIAFTPIDYPKLDLRAPESIRRQVEGRFKLILNCAAYTDVDGAETDPARARTINGFGVGDLAKACRDSGALLVHYSTDYVFDGRAREPYPVDAPRRPLSVYGQSKALGEELIEASGCEYLLIRTSWLYAPWSRNFVRTIAAAAKAKPKLQVVNDQHGRPTSAEHLARCSLRLLEQQARGTWHVTDGGQCTWFDLARQVAAAANPACVVEPCSSDRYPRPARRPAYSVLDIARTQAALGPMPDWTTNLAEVLPRLE